MYFLLILLLSIELPSIHALQSTEETNNENSWRKYLSKFREPKPNKQEEDLQTIIETEIEKIDDEMNQLQKETNPLTYNLTADNIMRENKKALNRDELNRTNRILLQIRDYLYYVENICLKSITKASFTPVSKLPTKQVSHGTHCKRWMLFFDQCNHEDFLTISAKSDKTLDRRIFSEQTDVLFSLTNNFTHSRIFRIEKQWYKKAIYSKQSSLEGLKKHTTLDDNFLTFFNIMYDVVVAFHERWEESRLSSDE